MNKLNFTGICKISCLSKNAFKGTETLAPQWKETFAVLLSELCIGIEKTPPSSIIKMINQFWKY